MYVALPPTAPAPGIVLLPPIFGIEPLICELADRYAARGFVVVVPNQFHRDAEPGIMARTDEGRAKALARAQRVDVDEIVDDVRATVAELRAMPQCNGHVAIAGFCFGGRYAFLAAARLDVQAAAGFHPAQIGRSLADASRVHAPLSLHFGAEDPVTPKDEVDAIAAALADRPDAAMFTYPGATHNFAIPGVPGYDAEVAALAEHRAFALFDQLK
ncbi:MAG: dienelactone hydrolase family protein [Candidatus Eremiobacteraeota bacterium]|nr:dienelactone hydrolase family protein [Candidatus Eremiobacteraeota bacterium]